MNGRIFKRGFVALFALAAALAAAGQTPPAWATKLPSPAGGETFFTGMGQAKGRAEAAAADAALANLASGMMMYVGVDMTAETSSSTTESKGAISSEYSSTVKGKASNHVTGFKIKDRVASYDRKSDLSTVWLLAGWKTADLEREKARVAALLQEKLDAVAVPEAAAKAALRAGKAVEAIAGYINAASAATGPGIENPEIKVKRNIAAAVGLLNQMSIEVAFPKGSIAVLAPWPGPLRVTVLYGSEGKAVPGVKIVLGYPRKSGTRLVTKSVSLMTDEQGVAEFVPPSPDFVGKARMTVKVDFAAQEDMLDALPPAYAPSLEPLLDAMSALQSNPEFTVVSRAKEIPTGLAILDFDEKGQGLPGNVSAASLQGVLTKAGFVLSPTQIDATLIVEAQPDRVREAASRGAAKRFVYGVTRITGLRQDSGMWIAEARVAATAIDVASGAVLWTADKQVTAVGNDEAQARRAILVEAGTNALGKDLLSNLP